MKVFMYEGEAETKQKKEKLKHQWSWKNDKMNFNELESFPHLFCLETGARNSDEIVLIRHIFPSI